MARIDNDPVLILSPPNFRPNVPPGFSVSVFAKDFVDPRWLSVSPNNFRLFFGVKGWGGTDYSAEDSSAAHGIP
jgi:hypothetical protein